MKRKFIPVEESFAKWKKEPGYVAAYALLEEEFALASSLIKARSEADMTQEQVAQGNGNNPGCGGASGERKGTTVDTNTGAICQSDPLTIAYYL